MNKLPHILTLSLIGVLGSWNQAIAANFSGDFSVTLQIDIADLNLS